MSRPVNVQAEAAFEIEGQRKPHANGAKRVNWDALDEIKPAAKQEIERRWLWQVMMEPDLLQLPRELFPGLAYAGTHTLFAGREKLGKSEVLGLVAARAETEAPIIYFNFEEHLRELAMRAARYGVDPTRLCVVEKVTGLDDIRTVIEQEGAEFAMIDSLTALMRTQLGVTDSENSDTWGGYVQLLTAVAHEADVCLLTSHHGTKENGSYRGHSSIGAGADLLVEMFKDKQSESRRRFKSIGRVRGVKVPALTWTGSLYTLEADTDGTASSVATSVRFCTTGRPVGFQDCRTSEPTAYGRLARRQPDVR